MKQFEDKGVGRYGITSTCYLQLIKRYFSAAGKFVQQCAHNSFAVLLNVFCAFKKNSFQLFCYFNFNFCVVCF